MNGVGAIGSRPMAVLATSSGVLSAALLTATLWWCRVGLDFTDEGFYLNWMAYPDQYDASVSEFGIVYHPLYWILNGNITHLRQANVLITFVLAFAVIFLIARQIRPLTVLPMWQRLALTSGLACSSLLYFGVGLLMPSYNSLVLQGALLAFCGVSLVAGSDLRQGAIAALLIGTGASLIFLAKPTSVIVGLTVAAMVLSSRDTRWRSRVGVLLGAGACGALELIVVAWAYDGSLGAFIDRIKVGKQLLDVLGGGAAFQRPLRWPHFRPGIGQLLVTLAATIATVCAIRALLAACVSRRCWWLTGAALAIFAVSPLVVHSSTFTAGNVYRGLVVLAAPGAVLVVMWMTRGSRGSRSLLDSRSVSAALALLITPHLLAFGSSASYWSVAGFMAIFWLLVAVSVLAAAPPRVVVGSVAVLAVCIPFFAARLLLVPLQSPYRQPSLATANVAIEVGRPNTTIRVNPDVAAFVTTTLQGVEDAGMQPGTPVLDLTGASPTLIWIWGAVSAASPWTLGGYPGSAATAEIALRRAPCDMVARMWVLTAPGGAREISPAVLSAVDASLLEDYVETTEWLAPVAVTQASKPIKHVLYRPTRSDAQASAVCASEGEAE